jgi:hypothetical protein
MSNIDKLNMAEVANVERIAGASIRKLADDDYPNAQLLTAVAYVVKRREDPKLNFEKFAESVEMADVLEIIGGTETEEEKK